MYEPSTRSRGTCAHNPRRFANGIAALCTTVLALGGTANAQPVGVPGFDVEHLRLSPGAQSSLVLGSGDLLPVGGLRLMLAGHYERDLLLVRGNGAGLGRVIGNRWAGVMAAAWTPVARLQLGIQVPVILYQGGDDLRMAGVTSPDRYGLGAPWIEGRFGWLAQASGDPVDLSLQLGLGLPLGSRAALAGDTGVAVLPQIGLGARLGRLLRFGVDLGASFRPRASLSGGTGQDEIGNLALVGVGVQTTGRGLRGEIAARTLLALSDEPSSGELLLGARQPVGTSMEIFVLAAKGVGRTPGTPAYRAIVGLAAGLGRRHPSLRVAAPQPTAPTRPPINAEAVAVDEVDRDPDPLRDMAEPCPAERVAAALAGCPLPDRDGDGTEDALDACIDEPGLASNGGCPARTKQLVRITRRSLVITQKIFFMTGKATINKRSFPLLDQVAKVIREHQDIVHITIEGHTDSRGKPASNRKLSRARAEAVRAFVVTRGLDPARLDAVGYGPDRPTDTNKTPRGRENNRRVEFNFTLSETTR